MRLYHFTSERFGLEAIRDERLKIARINELNDPFDFLGHVAAPPKERRRFRIARDQAHNKVGLMCMSKTWREPLLWAHYADKHRGICLGFDVPDGLPWLPVEYVSERPKGNFDHTPTAEAAIQLVSTKFRAWEYEREYRLIIDIQARLPDAVSGHYFWPFSDKMILREVIVGHLSPITRARLAAVLGQHAGAIEQKKARPAFQKFEIVEQRRKDLWK